MFFSRSSHPLLNRLSALLGGRDLINSPWGFSKRIFCLNSSISCFSYSHLEDLQSLLMGGLLLQAGLMLLWGSVGLRWFALRRIRPSQISGRGTRGSEQRLLPQEILLISLKFLAISLELLACNFSNILRDFTHGDFLNLLPRAIWSLLF